MQAQQRPLPTPVQQHLLMASLLMALPLSGAPLSRAPLFRAPLSPASHAPLSQASTPSLRRPQALLLLPLSPVFLGSPFPAAADPGPSAANPNEPASPGATTTPATGPETPQPHS